MFGSEHLFVLSSALAARRVTGDMTCCDFVCPFEGDSLLVGGRNETGVAVHTFRLGSWEGRSWILGDSKSPIVAMSDVKLGEVWCVCAVDQNSSMVYSVVAPRTVRKSQLFEEKIFGVSKVLWSSAVDEVWLSAQGKVLRVSRESMAVTSVIGQSLRALRPVQVVDGALMFAVSSSGLGCLFDSSGKEIQRSYSVDASDREGSGEYHLLDTSKALQVPGIPHLMVAWSQFGLCSWRLDTYGPCPNALLQLRTKVMRSGSKDGVGSGNTPVVKSNSGSGGSNGSSTGSNVRSMNKSSLHMARKALGRATVTCDDTGKIISCNHGVKDVFGHEPSDLTGTSVRTLFFLPRVKDRGGSVLLYSRQQPQHFSASELWKSIMGDLLKVRVVNGQCKNGTQVPLLISTSQMTVAGQVLYVLLFEQLKKKCAIMVVDESGVIYSATETLTMVCGWQASRVREKKCFFFCFGEKNVNGSYKQVQGKALSSVVTAPPPRKFLNGLKFNPSDVIDVSVKTAAHQTISVELQVIDFANEMYTIMVSLPGNKNENRAPDQLSHYVVGKVLGRGMCGEVREGTHKLTGCKVAIKHIRKSDFEEAGVEFNGLELDLMKGLCHPSVVQLFDCIQLHQEVVIIMELVSGGELFDYCMEK